MKYILVALFLAGCNSMPNLPTKTDIPVSEKCPKKEDIPVKPEIMSWDSLMKLDRYQRTIRMRLDRIAMEKYEAEMEAVIRGCSGL